MSQDVIHTVAAVVANDSGEILLVRKRGSTTFIQPGGKREPDEDSLTTLGREVLEELGVRVMPETALRLGEFEAAAVNEPGRKVRAEAFVVAIEGKPTPQAEIEEIAWVAPLAPYPVQVAPLSSLHILPAFAETASGGI